MHKTVMIFILAVMLLSGCSNKKEREAEAMSNYVSFRDAIIDNNGLTSENIPFSHRLEVNKLTDGRFEYVVTIYDADVAMYNI